MRQSEFLELVLPFKDRVFRLAKRLLISKEEAEDATQELFLKLWKNKEKLSKYKNIEAMAITMTKNYCLDRLKSKQADGLTLTHNNYQEKETLLDKKIEYKDSINKVYKLIESLPEQQRIVIQLRDVEQYSFEEISEVLNMQPTAIRVALSRARKSIQKGLIQQHNYGIS